MESDRASQPNVLHLLHWEDRQPGRAVGRAGCTTGCGIIRTGSAARTLLSFDHSQSQKEHSLRGLGGSEVPAQPGRRSGQTGQALVHFGRSRERRGYGSGMEQDQAGVPAERLDRRQRISDGRTAGGAALRQERRRVLGEHGQRLFKFSSGRDRSRSAALYSDARRACRDSRKDRPR